MSLVASVGQATFAPKDNKLPFAVPADGVLALYANDDKEEGNEGSAEVTVSISAKSRLTHQRTVPRSIIWIVRRRGRTRISIRLVSPA